MAFFRRHLWGGLLATLIAIAGVGIVLWQTGRLAPFLTVEEAPKLGILIAVGLLSACFPDIDIGSVSQRIFYRILLVLDIWLLVQRNYKAAALLGLVAILPLLGKHRGWTHTWLAAVLVPATFFLAPMLINEQPNLFLGICYVVSVVAYISHLVLDGYIGRTVKRATRLVGRK